MIKNFLNSKWLSFILFLIYILILTWVIVAKMDWSTLATSDFSWVNNPRVLLHPGVTWSKINLEPFAYFDYIEVLLNILFFIPFGMFLKVLNKRFGIISTTFLAFILSASYESIQYILNIGFCDITDIIDNTLGAFIGAIIIKLFYLIFKEDLRIYSNLALIGITSYILYEIYYVL